MVGDRNNKNDVKEKEASLKVRLGPDYRLIIIFLRSSSIFQKN
jgi:hypothetical protein